jgi:hypothetical protein
MWECSIQHSSRSRFNPPILLHDHYETNKSIARHGRNIATAKRSVKVTTRASSRVAHAEKPKDGLFLPIPSFLEKSSCLFKLAFWVADLHADTWTISIGQMVYGERAMASP